MITFLIKDYSSPNSLWNTLHSYLIYQRLFFHLFLNFLEYLNAQLQSVNVSCQISDQLRESCDKESAKDWLGISIVFIGILLIGIGNAAIISLGTPYLDDNTGKKSSPMALSLGFAARVAGPAIGYIIGYICLKEFVNPGEEPEGIY